MFVKTDAIVLRQTNYREADRILTLFSYEHGKIQAIAKGCRKPNSPLIAGSQLFSYSRFLLYKGSNMYNISQSEVKESFYGIRENLLSITYGSYIAQLTESVIQEEEQSKRLFSLTLKLLTILSTIDKNHSLIARAFEIKLITLLGFQPNLNSCVKCGNSDLKDLRFSAAQGGILCPKCHIYDSYSIKIGGTELGILKYLLKSDITNALSIKTNEEVEKKLEKIMLVYLRTQLEKSYNTLDFIEKIRDIEG